RGAGVAAVEPHRAGPRAGEEPDGLPAQIDVAQGAQPHLSGLGEERLLARQDLFAAGLEPDERHLLADPRRIGMAEDREPDDQPPADGLDRLRLAPGVEVHPAPDLLAFAGHARSVVRAGEAGKRGVLRYGPPETELPENGCGHVERAAL